MTRPNTSRELPAAIGTIIAMGRIGKDCGTATSGNACMVAAAPANCMNVRRGSFMVYPLATPKLSHFPILEKGPD